MPFLLAIGIDEIDRQHERWLQIIEEFRSVGSDNLLNEGGFFAAEQALIKLLKYTKMHFASEECLMAEEAYPDLEAHRRRHLELESSVAKMLDELRKHKSTLTPLKLNLLCTIWLCEHISKEDLKFSQFMTGKA